MKQYCWSHHLPGSFQINHQDNNGLTAMSYAVIGGHLDVIQYLFNCEWSIREVSLSLAVQSAFVLSSSSDYPKITEFLLDKIEELDNCHIDGIDQWTGSTALTNACLYGNKAAVRILIARKATLEQPNSDGYSPFLCAAKAGSLDISVMLLEHGVAIEGVDNFGHTALMFSSAEGHAELVSMLLTNGLYIQVSI